MPVRSTPSLRAIGGGPVNADIVPPEAQPDWTNAMVVIIANGADLGGSPLKPPQGSSNEAMATQLEALGAVVKFVPIANGLCIHNTGATANARKEMTAHAGRKAVIMSVHGSGTDRTGICHIQVQHKNIKAAAVPTATVVNWIEATFPGTQGIHMDVCFAAVGIEAAGEALRTWKSKGNVTVTGTAHALDEDRSAAYAVAGLTAIWGP